MRPTTREKQFNYSSMLPKAHPVPIALHLFLTGIWLGCVLTKVFFERAMLAGDRESHRRVAHLHAKDDLLIEVPVFSGMLVSGLIAWRGSPTGAALVIMNAAGGIAIVANVVCVCLVLRRRTAAVAGNRESFARLDCLQHKIGAIALVGILVALGAGPAGHRVG